MSTAGRKVHATTESYLEYLDGKLGLPQGTLYNRCVASVKSKVVAESGVTVTYRGVTMRSKRRGTARYVEMKKAVFLIEFKMTKAGKQYDRTSQVHLEL